MPLKQQIFAYALCAIFTLVVILLVRRRRLEESYSLLWLATCAIMFTLVWHYDLLAWITHLAGIVLATSTLFLSALFFLFMMAVVFSVRSSVQALRLKNLAQEMAMLRSEVEELKKSGKAGAPAADMQKQGRIDR